MKLTPLKIGNVTIDFPVILAPMAGYTDAAFRSICSDFHAGLAYTEVTNAQGLVYGSKPTLHLLEKNKNEGPVAAHIYGSNPESMTKAAEIIEALDRFDMIDVNCGCPVRKIVAKGSGAALMKDPDTIYKIVKAIKEVSSLPVTIKTRIGLTPDNMNIQETGHAAEEAGASAIAIHARFASNHHNGPADWDILRMIKAELTIPVIGNGGVNKPDDAIRMFEETGVDAVMIGRAAVGNPWIFTEIENIINAEETEPHSTEEHKAIIREHLARAIQLAEIAQTHLRKRSIPEERASLHFRAHLYKYLAGFKGHKQFVRKLQTMNSPEVIIDSINKILIATNRQRS